MPSRSELLTAMMITECGLVIIVSTPLVIAIIKKRAYKERKDHVMILFLLAADIFYALSFGYQTLERHLVDDDDNRNFSERMPRIDADLCNFHPTCILMFTSVQVLGAINLSVAVDRLIATAWPTKYYSQGPRSSVLLMSIAFFFYILNVVLNYADERKMQYFCPYYSFPHPALDSFFTYHRLVSTSMTIPIYSIIGVLLWKRTLRNRILNPLQSTGYMQAHFTMALTTLSAIVFLMIPEILMNFIKIGWSSDWRLILYCVVLTKVRHLTVLESV